MKCYYTIDKETLKKVFIPMCLGTIYTHKVEDCCCDEPIANHQFEKERFNKVVQKQNETIISMASEILHLNSIIDNINKK